MAILNEYPRTFNVIPIPRNSKIPIFKWETYQEKPYPREKILEDNGNYAVICGKISNNLLVFDLDFRDKKNFNLVFDEFVKEFPEISDTCIISTPHGYHLYYYTKDFTEDRHPNKNAGYNKSNKFVGTTKTNFSNYLNGFDVLGNNGYAIIPPSRIDGLSYEKFNDKPIKFITKEEYDKLKKFFLLDTPKKVRKPFLDILNGVIDIEDQANTHGKEEFVYWKYLFREVYHYCGLLPEEIFEGLSKNQACFDVEKTKTQLEYHDFKENPMTNDTLKEYFPNHSIPKKKKKIVKDAFHVKTFEELKKEDSEEVKKFAEEFLNLSGREKFQIIDDILKSEIAGEKNTRLLVYALMLSNYRYDFRTSVIIRGSSSSGKNHLVITIMNLIPERDIEEFSSATASVFNYENLDEKKMLYLREMRKDENSEEVFKALIDGDRVHKEVVRIKGRNMVVDHFLKSVGLITTLSFETLQIDLINRSWVITLDESILQTKRINEFKQQNRKNVIEYDIQKEKIVKQACLISESYKYLDWSYKVKISFIEKLNALLPENPKINLRRDDDKLYDLIEIITIFNQKNRKSIQIGNKNYLFSEYEDLEIALDIAQDLYIDLILHIDPIKRQILDCFQDLKVTLTITKVFETLRDQIGTRKSIERKLHDLESEGYLSKMKEKNVWKFRKLKDVDFLYALNMEVMREEINDLIEQDYIFYSNKTKEVLEE